MQDAVAGARQGGRHRGLGKRRAHDERVDGRRQVLVFGHLIGYHEMGIGGTLLQDSAFVAVFAFVGYMSAPVGLQDRALVVLR